MEEKLLELFKIADSLNEKQENVFAEIAYCADNSKKLEISIRKKKDYSYVEKCEIMLVNNSVSKLDAIINIFNDYTGGASNE